MTVISETYLKLYAFLFLVDVVFILFAIIRKDWNRLPVWVFSTMYIFIGMMSSLYAYNGHWF